MFKEPELANHPVFIEEGYDIVHCVQCLYASSKQRDRDIREIPLFAFRCLPE